MNRLKRNLLSAVDAKALWTRSKISWNDRSIVTLNDGHKVPMLGLGLYRTNPGNETYKATLAALEKGYKLIDTASFYKNEKSVGEAIKASNIPRTELFIVTKVWDTMHGYQKALKSLEESLEDLNTNYVDLLLIHSPVGGKIIETWSALIDARCKGLTRSIGVSNFGINHISSLCKYSDIIPAVNQIEVHPFLQELRTVTHCSAYNIKIMAYSPLTRGKKLDHPVVSMIAKKHGKTSAQVLIRWSIQTGFVCIPKSINPDRIAENSLVFDFFLDEADMNCLNSLDENFRTGTDKTNVEWVLD